MKKNNKRESIIIAVILLVVLAVAFYLDAKLPSYHIAIKVIKKAAVYSLVAVSMNLLNGFTGLFSLGQAGFMLLGAYAYAVLSIPVDKRAGVYQYFNGGIVKFSLPEVFSGIFGQNVGSVVGMIVALMIGGLIAALVAYLIGLPVLRLKSDYLAIATLGFADRDSERMLAGSRGEIPAEARLARLWVDGPAPGDVMCPLGMSGRSKKVSDLLNEARIPVSERAGVPVVRTAPGGAVVWVAGVRTDERFKCTAATRVAYLLRVVDAE